MGVLVMMKIFNFFNENKNKHVRTSKNHLVLLSLSRKYIIFSYINYFFLHTNMLDGLIDGKK